MPKNRSYVAEIQHRVDGIPCLIGVLDYNRTAGSYSSRAETPDEYYGYTESNWEILDRRGYPAPWLERKLNDRERDFVEEALFLHFG